MGDRVTKPFGGTVNQLDPTSEMRIRRLERSSRIYALLFWMMVGVAVMGQLPQSKKKIAPTPNATPAVVDTLSAHNFRLVDEQGRPRANFFISDDEVYLVLGESNGTSRLALRVKDQGETSVVLAGSDGEPKATLQCAADGSVRRFP
jgi:hypothetical protein